MKTRKIPLSQFKQVLSLKKKIGDHFTAVTGIVASEVEFLWLTEAYQSDCDGDDNNIRVQIKNIGKGYGENVEVIDVLKAYNLVVKHFNLVAKVEQEASGIGNFPTITTTFTFSYYNFTKK